MSGSAIPYNATNGFPPRMGPGLYGNPFVNAGYGNVVAQQQQQPAAIIQMNGSMVTIRNPALHQALSGSQPMEYHDGTKTMRNVDGPRNPNINGEDFTYWPH